MPNGTVLFDWGNNGWGFGHAVSFSMGSYPSDEEKKHFKEFFESWQHVLPCPKCRKHYSEHLKKNPVNVHSVRDLAQWFFDLHNTVNLQTGKSKYHLNFLEYVEQETDLKFWSLDAGFTEKEIQYIQTLSSNRNKNKSLLIGLLGLLGLFVVFGIIICGKTCWKKKSK